MHKVDWIFFHEFVVVDILFGGSLESILERRAIEALGRHYLVTILQNQSKAHVFNCNGIHSIQGALASLH